MVTHSGEQITGVTLVAPNYGGSGYVLSGQQITFPAPPPSVPATATATVNTSGVVTTFAMTNKGTGYVAAPPVQIAPPVQNVTATGTAVLANSSVAGVSMAGGYINPTGASNGGGVSFIGSYAQLVRMTEDAACIIKGSGFISTIHNDPIAGATAQCTNTAIDASAEIIMPSFHAEQDFGINAAQNYLYCSGVSWVGNASPVGPPEYCNTLNAGATAITSLNFHTKPGNATVDGQNGFDVENEMANQYCAVVGQNGASICQGFSSYPGILQPAERMKPFYNGEAGYSATNGNGWLGEGGVSYVTITNPGAGYKVPPAVTFSGSTGCCATATAVLNSDGTVGRVALTYGGVGYTTQPNVTIAQSPLGANYTATATATYLNGSITGVTVTNPGSGYKEPTVAFDPPPDCPGTSTVCGTTATGTVVVAPDGTVSSVTMNNPGSGYTNGAPGVSFAGGGYTTLAHGTAVDLGQSSDLSIIPDYQASLAARYMLMMWTLGITNFDWYQEDGGSALSTTGNVMTEPGMAYTFMGNALTQGGQNNMTMSVPCFNVPGGTQWQCQITDGLHVFTFIWDTDFATNHCTSTSDSDYGSSCHTYGQGNIPANYTYSCNVFGACSSISGNTVQVGVLPIELFEFNPN